MKESRGGRGGEVDGLFISLYYEKEEE